MDDITLQTLVREFIEKLSIVFDSVHIHTIVGQRICTVHTADSKQLIGPHGEHLRALNYVIRKLVEKRFGNDAVGFIVDVNGYQERNIRELEQKAQLLAERVRTFKSSVDMAPMSGYERMIIHSMFSADNNITTKSEGEGLTRHVVLRYVEHKNNNEIQP